MRPNSSAIRRLALALLIVVGLTPAGCGFGKKPDVTVTDPGGRFHVKIPAEWQARMDPGLIGLYAAKKLPSTDSLDSMSMVIFNAEATPEKTDLAKRLKKIVEKRAADRKWTDVKYGKVEKTMIGKRPGHKILVSGKDGKKRQFAGDYYLIRTANTEVFIVCAAPADKWEANAPGAARVLENWYWHFPETPAGKSGKVEKAKNDKKK